MNEEDEAFNDIERQAKQRKEAVKAAINKEKPMSDEETIRYRDAFPKDYDLPTYFTSKHAASMTLRDYFAAKAMQALIDNDGLFSEIPTQAYALADVMLKAREA